MPTAISIRDVGSLATKFVRRGQAAVEDWKTGIQQTTKSQSGEAIAAAPRWQQALQGDAVLARFKAKLTAAGDGKWRDNAVTKGATQGRFAGGIGAAGPAWAAGVTPIFDALRNRGGSQSRWKDVTPHELLVRRVRPLQVGDAPR